MIDFTQDVPINFSTSWKLLQGRSSNVPQDASSSLPPQNSEVVKSPNKWIPSKLSKLHEHICIILIYVFAHQQCQNLISKSPNLTSVTYNPGSSCWSQPCTQRELNVSSFLGYNVVLRSCHRLKLQKYFIYLFHFYWRPSQSTILSGLQFQKKYIKNIF